MTKFLYLISQTENNNYDTYDSAVVIASTEEEARNINLDSKWEEKYSSWCSSPEKVKVKLLGVADNELKGHHHNGSSTVVIASFNAG